MYASVLVQILCSVLLQCVVLVQILCSVLQALQCVAVFCSVLQRVAVCCSVVIDFVSSVVMYAFCFCGNTSSVLQSI